MSASSIAAGAASSPSDVLVRKSITVSTSRERAFQVFTQEMSSWWPLVSHHIGKVDAKDVVMEPTNGGRWYERGVDGSECEWGHVVSWEPPNRLVLAWQITSTWQFDTAIDTEIEVRFTSTGDATLVELEHRRLESYGAKAIEMRELFDSNSGWGGLLEAFARRVAQG